MKKLFSYLKESKAEFNKVTWPTRKETVQYSLLVVAVSILLAVFIGLVDYVLNLGVLQVLPESQTPAIMEDASSFSPDIEVVTEDIDITTDALDN